MRQLLSYIHIALVIFVTQAAYGAGHPADIDHAIQKSGSLWAKGDVAGAIRESKKAYQLSKYFASPGDQQLLVEHALNICSRVSDEICIDQLLPDYMTILKAADVDEPWKRALMYRGLYFIMTLYGLQGDEENTLKNVDLLEEDQFGLDAIYYVRRQLLLSEIRLAHGQRDLARRALDRALAQLAAIKNPRSAARDIAVQISRAIDVLVNMEDYERANGLLLATDTLLATAFHPNSFDALHILSAAAILREALGQPQEARGATESALRILHGVTLPRYMKDAGTGALNTILSVLCLITDDVKCAESAVANNPLAGRVRAAAKRKEIEGDEVAYLVTRSLVRMSTGKPADAETRSLLSLNISQSGDVDTDRALDAIRRIGLAVESRDQDSEELRSRMRDSARVLLDATSSRSTSSAIAFGSRGAIDFLVLRMALMAFTSEHPLDETDAANVLSLFEATNRSTDTFEFDALRILSQAKDQLESDALRSLIRLRARRNALERSRLLEVSRRIQEDTGSEQKSYIEIDVGVHQQLAEYGDRIDLAEQAINNERTTSDARSRIETLKTLKASLSPSEALIGVVPLVDRLAYLCIRRDQVWFREGTRLQPNFFTSIKLLQAALSYSGPADETIDRQFPISAATELYGTLLSPFEQCLHAVDSIIWTTDRAAVPLPISALLTRTPSETEVSAGLASWPWAVKRFAITQVPLPSLIPALRGRLSVSASTQAFLGIGDPKLEGNADSGDSRFLVATRGAVNLRSSTELPPLPETKDELLESSRSFSSPSMVLTGEDATELAFRRQNLRTYGMLSFATHGLIREEIPGLSEPALVLTPRSSSDPFDDGLLTASEIADLPLAARFVALSACNSATSDPGRFASELSALSSAFAVAGVPATLGTLWPVESDASRRIVAGVFERLGRRSSATPSQALAESQRAYLDSVPDVAHGHPRFWAPFVMLGDGLFDSSNRAGDSTASLVERIEHAQPTTFSYGEILTAAPFRGGMLLHGIGLPKDGRAAAMTILRDADGKEVWRVHDWTVGASKWLLPHGQEVLLGGYEAGPGNFVRGVIDIMDEQGRRRRVATFSDRGDWNMPAAALDLDSQSILVAIDTEETDPGNDEQRRSIVRLVRVGMNGTVEPIGETPDLGLGGSGIQVSLARFADKIYIFASTRFSAPVKDPYRSHSVMHASWSCVVEPRTRVFVVGAAGGPVRDIGVLPRIFVSHAANVNGSEVWLTGSLAEDCDHAHRRFSIWKMNASGGLESLFVADGYGIESEGRGILQLPSGNVLATGGRSVSLAAENWNVRTTNAATSNADSFDIRARWSLTSVAEGSLALLSPTGSLIETGGIRTGADVQINGATSSGDSVLVYGLSASEAAIFTYGHSAPH